MDLNLDGLMIESHCNPPLAIDLEIEVEERNVTVAEILEASKNDTLQEDVC
mgnify:CR=1 FL=1